MSSSLSVAAMLLVLFSLCLLQLSLAGTGIKVINNYKKEVNVKISGMGVGGCDVLIQPGEINDSDCWCLWGTLNYGFCAYYKKGISGPADTYNLRNSTSSLPDKDGKCPVKTGEDVLCSDVTSLGNCYKSGYVCTIGADATCLCTY
jgi:hypothetical protein